MNSLRSRIENHQRTRGALVSLTDPCLCEIMGHVGFDCVWIDMEHTYMSNKEVLCHLNAARSAGISAVVRVPQDDLTVTKQVLEMGADGIIFPMVRTPQQARELIDMTLYPPYGNRGFGPLRAIRYGADDARGYVERGCFDLCKFIQIEHIDCIDNLEEMLAIPHLDGFIFGPNDLSGSLGEMLRVYDGRTVEQMKRAVEILRRHGKYFGIAGGMDRQTIAFWSQFEPDMMFAGADWNYIYAHGVQTLELLKEYNG